MNVHAYSVSSPPSIIHILISQCYYGLLMNRRVSPIISTFIFSNFLSLHGIWKKTNKIQCVTRFSYIIQSWLGWFLTRRISLHEIFYRNVIVIVHYNEEEFFIHNLVDNTEWLKGLWIRKDFRWWNRIYIHVKIIF